MLWLNLISALFLFKSAKQLCSTGCLQCIQNICNFCDFTNGFILSSGQCNLGNKTSCAVTSQSGACFSCWNNMYIDPISLKCIAIPSKNIIPNCHIYETSQSCALCVQNYYIYAKGCSAITQYVQNCQFYVKNGVCRQCVQGYIPSNDNKSCLKIIQEKSCLNYSFIKCQSCLPGYVLNQNEYFQNFKNSTILSNLIDVKPKSVVISQLSVCISTNIIANCTKMNDIGNCFECEGGFFLYGGICIQNPPVAIFECRVYESYSSCVECQNEYFLLNSSNCSPVKPIQNCVLYNGSIPITSCIACNTTYYLNQKTCQMRRMSISIYSCETYSNNNDTCSKCASGFRLSSDSLACFPVLANCSVYSTSSYLQNNLQCSLCSPGYYMTTESSISTCVPGGISNCTIFNQNGLNCLSCENGYYLSNNICLKHVLIANCSMYSQSILNTCNYCTSGTYLFILANKCVQVSVIIQNCQVYTQNGTSCIQCTNQTFLNNGSCAQIPNPVTKCAVYNGTICLACQNDYMLSTMLAQYSCVAPFDYITYSCAQKQPPGSIPFTWENSTSNPLNCQSCNIFNFAYSPSNSEAICVANSQAGLYQVGFSFTSVPNCYRFGLNYNIIAQIVCMQCIQGTFLSNYWLNNINSAETTCTSVCSTANGMNVIIPDDLFGFVNICVPADGSPIGIIGTSCSVYARFTSFNQGMISDYSCLVASSEFILTYTLPVSANFLIDLPGSLYPRAFSILADVGHGYVENLFSSSISSVSIFNYRGIIGFQSFNVSSLWGSPITNCEIAWSPGQLGSRGGASSGLLRIPVNAIQCLRCRFGLFQVQITNSAINSVPSCVQMTTCISSIRVGGLPSFLNTIVGCHFCYSFGIFPQFPTIFIEYGGLGGLTDYNIWYQFAISSTQNSTGFSCTIAPTKIVTISTDPISGSVQQAGSNLISTCAIFGVITSIGASNVIINKISVCLACSAGYYPNYATFVPTTNSIPYWAVSSCRMSSNCDTSIKNTAFNSCTKCVQGIDTGSIGSYYAFSDFTLANCVFVNSANCFMILNGTLASPPSTSKCGICNNGYFLNIDYFCETITIPNADRASNFVVSYYSTWFLQNQQTISQNFDSLAVRYTYLRYFFGTTFGITNTNKYPCMTNYTLAPVSQYAKTLCVLSSYLLAGNQYLIPLTNFVANCLSYNSTYVPNYNWLDIPEHKIKCALCSQNFIPTIDGLSCVPSLNNCAFAYPKPNIFICFLCSSGFFNVGGFCTLNFVKNCQIHQNQEGTFELNRIFCLICQSGFWLSVDKQSCYQGTIKNCAVYQTGSEIICLACIEGYALMTLNELVNYCYPIDPSLNCSVLSTGDYQSGLNSGIIFCSTCNSNSTLVLGTASFVPTINQSQHVCLPFQQIANCVSYDQNNVNISMNSFNCTVCLPNFWLSPLNNTCVQRINVHDNCTLFSNYSDVCLKCMFGYFLSSNRLSCVLYSQGIPGCLVYTSLNFCQMCASPYFVSNGACVLSKMIENCLIYSDNSICHQCQIGYYLLNSTNCLPTEAINCLIASSQYECLTCASNFGLQKVGLYTNCGELLLPNCVQTSSNFPLKCLICENIYFPNINGTCQKISRLIRNCLIYDSSMTCAVCQIGSVLSVDKSVCNNTYYKNLIDQNCQMQYLLSYPDCSICSFGSFFRNGICVNCVNQTLEKGCLFCSPGNNSVCLVCSPGYYQNSTGECINALSPFPLSNATTNMTVKKALILKVGLVFCLQIYCINNFF